jgi:protoporphyrinogen oxidase
VLARDSGKHNEEENLENIAIMGSGMAGLGAAWRLRSEGIAPVIYEKNGYYGGHAASFHFDSGFLFDEGPHISFTKDPRIQDLLADGVDQQYQTIQINLNNYWHGYWPQHPVQLHLHGLPQDVVVKVITDFVEESKKPDRPVRTYAEWLVANFGRTFAELFPMEYTRKYHLNNAENMSLDWLGPRFYRPSLDEMLRGALAPTTANVHYITHFRYPNEGGFVSFLKKLAPPENLKLGYELVSIDASEHQLFFANGIISSYDGLISSIPLPALIPMIKGVPQEILEASRRLACSTCVLVNLGVDREDLSEAHMTYFYDKDICFARLSFPHLLSERNVPPHTGSIQAEVYFSDKYKPMTGTPDDWIQPVITDLHRCGLLRENDQILFSKARLVKYANIIFDLERAAALERVHGYLDEVGMRYCGRYGNWGYEWTDEAFKSGEDAAQKTLDMMKSLVAR